MRNQDSGGGVALADALDGDDEDEHEEERHYAHHHHAERHHVHCLSKFIFTPPRKKHKNKK
jgi:hypothetical protein